MSHESPQADDQPAAVAATADLTDWLGMPESHIVAVLGQPDERPEFEDEKTAYLTYLKLGLSILIEDACVAAVLAYSGRVGGYETMNWSRYQGAFRCGLHFDMLPDDVVRLLGSPEYSDCYPDATIPSLSKSYPSRGVGITFIEATEKIIYIILFTPRIVTDLSI